MKYYVIKTHLIVVMRCVFYRVKIKSIDQKKYGYSSVKHSDKRLLKRLIKKLDVINYFYMENDNIKKFTILASEYKDLNDIKDRIRGE
jgi:hypothetical protein